MPFQLPLLCRTAGDIVEVFLIKHSLVATHYARFSFASPNFKPEVDPLETEEFTAKTTVPEARNVIIIQFSFLPWMISENPLSKKLQEQILNLKRNPNICDSI